VTDAQSPRRLYLVRHGQAKPKEEDPERGLTEAGRRDVVSMAAWAVAAGIQVDKIRHSGKLRAEQTAEIFAAHLGTQAKAASGLGPNDDITDVAASIRREQGDQMLVGHLPFLERLAAFLIGSHATDGVVSLEAGAILELIESDKGWRVTCLMQPRLLSSV
jgi:phosphohistidine phosphatase